MPYAMFEKDERVRMLFYDSANPAPNPRRVRIYLAEKGLRVPTAQVSIPAGEHRGEEYLKVNPLGQTPSLVLDDSSVLTESISICRYFEGLHPEPALFGIGAQDVAEVDMWIRRVEMRLSIPIGAVWMHTHPFTARVVKPQFPEYGETQRLRALAVMGEFDRTLDGQEFLDGRRYSMADIVLLTSIDFAAFIGLAVPEEYEALRAWHERVSARPSAQA
ncbi:MAG: glutathione S-transferase [Sphingomonas bacterium]|nr:glutathione S-transferase [Sphingomonas bacterium]